MLIKSWLYRGIFMIFFGANQFILSDMKTIASNTSAFSTDALNAVSSQIVLYSGVLYFIMSFLCIEYLKNREMTQIRIKKQLAFQTEQLIAHKSDIEILLKDNGGSKVSV